MHILALVKGYTLDKAPSELFPVVSHLPHNSMGFQLLILYTTEMFYLV